MSVAYGRWLIARGNVFMPSAAAVAKVVEELRSARFIVEPSPAALERLRFEGDREAYAKKTGGHAVKTVENTFGGKMAAIIAASTEAQPPAITAEWLEDPDREELRLVWPVRTSRDGGLKHPLSMTPDDANVEYTLEVHRAPEYVYPVAETIGRIPTKCACSEPLDFEWDRDEVVPAFDASTGIFAECDECSRTFDPSKGSAKITNPFDGTVEKVAGGAAYRFAIKVECAKGTFARDAKLAFAPELVALVEKAFGRQFYEIGALARA